MNNYLSNSDVEEREMLEAIGKTSIEDLFCMIKDDVRLKRELKIGDAKSEIEIVNFFGGLASQNLNHVQNPTFLGAGLYDHYTPSAVDALISRQEFYTAYTPYQAEISQGMLQAIFEFQTMICKLTGLSAANASMYDGATALAEAVILSCGASGKNEVVVPDSINPEYIEVLTTYAKGKSINVRVIATQKGKIGDLGLSGDTSCFVLPYPNYYGIVEDIEEIIKKSHDQGAHVIVVSDPVSLALLKNPGECGADMCVGEGSFVGNSISFGGPLLGFFAANEKLMRRIPGRVVGQTMDKHGRRGYVLTLQAREQHIRREKASSNICSNEALCALATTITLSLMGKQGLYEVALNSAKAAHYMFTQLVEKGLAKPIFEGEFFREFAVKLNVDADKVNQALMQNGIIGGLKLKKVNSSFDDNDYLIAVTEKRSKAQIDKFIKIISEVQ